jgi:hypothetical protein
MSQFEAISYFSMSPKTRTHLSFGFEFQNRHHEKLSSKKRLDWRRIPRSIHVDLLPLDGDRLRSGRRADCWLHLHDHRLWLWDRFGNPLAAKAKRPFGFEFWEIPELWAFGDSPGLSDLFCLLDDIQRDHGA